MIVTIEDISKCLEQIAPAAIAEPWDNVGLLVGDQDRTVRSILVGLDPTLSLLEEAITLGADTVITHHPAIFKPLPAINTAEPSGKFLETALKQSITVFACHTNFDSVVPGVNDILMELLGISSSHPLIPSTSQPLDGAGMGRIGSYAQPISDKTFINRLLEILSLSSVMVAGKIPPEIQTVAVCGGSGSEFAETARKAGADLYLTAEVKHNIARWAEDAGFCVIDGTHYATEKPAITLLTKTLRAFAQENSWDIRIEETKTEHHPLTPVDTNNFKHLNH